MATIQSRPFSKNYSGLINQSVIAGCIFVLCITAHECMKRKRRGVNRDERVGSVESWEFGYLYQGRTWAKNPSPPTPRGWPLGWVKEVTKVSEDKFNELRGIDATLYVRFLRGCWWYTLIQSFTTLPILLPIHSIFSDGTVSPKSMTRASITSLVSTAKGQSLLWIHLLLLIWITASWIGFLVWLMKGVFHFRARNIVAAGEERERIDEQNLMDYLHPHPQYPFKSSVPLDTERLNRGVRLRTVMVTNIPPGLRTEKDLKEYFEYYLSRRIAKPALGITSTTQPGFFNKSVSFLLNRMSRLLGNWRVLPGSPKSEPEEQDQRGFDQLQSPTATGDVPAIERVAVVRRMTELANLLMRREEYLRLLETAHIKLAKRALVVVKTSLEQQQAGAAKGKGINSITNVGEQSGSGADGRGDSKYRDQLLVETLKPFVKPQRGRSLFTRESVQPDYLPTLTDSPQELSPATPIAPERTVWDALLSLPRSTLEAYQPLTRLSTLYRGQVVPTIDFYTAKLQLLSSVITEKRARAPGEYEPMSTAFVTFEDPADARRACKYLAVHPLNPLQCFVTMAPSYEDLDWNRLMKPTFQVEFVKDWLVNIGVWGFTVFWIFPVSLFVTLVSIQNISSFWPGLKAYLDKHPWEEELIQSFVPTLLVSLLALLIPLLLLLIAKKAHTIATLSALHDRIMTRYYKFLVVNVLVFFCVGTAAVQSFLVSFSATSGLEVIQVVADSFPTAGPFYVGWLIFTMAMHGGLELALCELPLIMYPNTRRQVTPRKRAVGIRPRTFNYYYWLPNHTLVLHIVVVFAVLNPLIIPFAFLYFCVESGVIRNQLLHVYAKNYEGNGQTLLIRIIRYSCDGLMLSQVVFLAYMVVLKKKANVGVSAVLIILTAFTKVILTRICRAKFEQDDLLEGQVMCGTAAVPEAVLDAAQSKDKNVTVTETSTIAEPKADSSHTLPPAIRAWQFPNKIGNGYATIPRRPQHRGERHGNPFSSMDSRPSIDVLRPGSPTTFPRMTDGEESFVDVLPHIPENDQSPREPAVTRHPPHPRWNDESSSDHPYDNPYYVKPIKDELWLPADPAGLLNLDDTVNMRVSLTNSPGVGRLGDWYEDEFIVTGLSSFLSSTASVDHRMASFDGRARRLNGTEHIELPSDIASRVGSLDMERELETVPSLHPPSRRRDRQYSHTSSMASPEMAELGFPNGGPPRMGGLRSSSLGPGMPGYQRHLPSAFLNAANADRRIRSFSDHEMALRPSNVRSRSTLGLPPIMQPEASVGGMSIVSLREAVVEEAIVEEEAEQEHFRQEEGEEEKAEKPRSRWTSWMFAKWY
ncbi:uncharacterized protein B0H18DRAFT_1091982 [Fomitopsis serialis]|uniref:uncharacterized protein n=1 Tax=Fomitopsis serialis TaxID=139415 RepID=UPI00200760F3|nr:uncharacterized protein B0H18DRAFT_1091982 [Neoantrodia serialis]KAH9936413.1 hypothetical protein B0H18DRAFT_1091982 [Neoantrodia serialis]